LICEPASIVRDALFRKMGTGHWVALISDTRGLQSLAGFAIRLILVAYGEALRDHHEVAGLSGPYQRGPR
jgi:hypothetical protein